ncbi:uncharacterized protein LOC122517838 [Polistes fuscatus]|uniref:uncharacterized protein LOC122517838 n=1 Tax=Polistes fuscatus TaxID=30207 RepID=UPI001CA8EA3B|nr:uncharacterized protein LOC122517838 [Polistes fuscatus]
MKLLVNFLLYVSMISKVSADLRVTFNDLNVTLLKLAIQTVLVSEDIKEIIFAIDLEIPSRNADTEMRKVIDATLNDVTRSKRSFLVEPLSSIKSEKYHSKITCSTLIVDVTSKKKLLDQREVEDFGILIRSLMPTSDAPKILWIVHDKDENNFNSTLQQMWKLHLLDVTILELSGYHKFERNVTVHRYNPFVKYYTRLSWNAEIILFPYKIDNLHGYKLKTNINDEHPYEEILRDPKNGGRIVLGGLSENIFKTWSEIMNFSLIVDEKIKMRRKISRVDGNLAITIENLNELDLMYRLCLQSAFLISAVYTVPVNSDDICIMVPRISMKRQIDFSHVLFALFIIFLIVILFWIISRLSKSASNVFDPINIISLLLGVAITPNSNGLSGRTIFLSIMAARMCYLDIFYEELLNINTDVESEIEFNNYDDILRQDIKIMYLNVSFPFFKQYFGNDTILKRMVQTPDIKECVKHLILYKNTSCYHETSKLRLIYMSKRYNGKPITKVTDICQKNRYLVYLLPKTTPYLNRFNEILLRIIESGIKDKWSRDWLFNLEKKHKMNYSVNANAVMQQSIITIMKFLLYDYLIIFVLFVLELLFHYFDRATTFSQ